MIKVLIVEDSLTQRQIISELLKHSGFQVYFARDGVEAMEQIQQTNPDLIVLDIVMPRMNGYEVCRHIKSDPKTKNLPVVMCSSKKEEFDKHWGMKQGADAYITKPFQGKDLIYAIKELVQTQS